MTRMQSQAAVEKRKDHGDVLDVLRRKSQGVILRKQSQEEELRRQSQGDILKRATKKNSVANAVAVIGVTEALLLGKIAWIDVNVLTLSTI